MCALPHIFYGRDGIFSRKVIIFAVLLLRKGTASSGACTVGKQETYLTHLTMGVTGFDSG